MTIMDKIKQFDDLLSSGDFGGGDTEPQSVFHVIIKRAVLGQKVDWDNINWELFRSMQGHDAFRDNVTAEAKLLYEEIRKAPISEIANLRDYAWRADFDLEPAPDGRI